MSITNDTQPQVIADGSLEGAFPSDFLLTSYGERPPPPTRSREPHRRTDGAHPSGMCFPGSPGKSIEVIREMLQMTTITACRKTLP